MTRASSTPVSKLLEHALARIDGANEPGERGEGWITVAGAMMLSGATNEAERALERAAQAFDEAERQEDALAARLRATHLKRLQGDLKAGFELELTAFPSPPKHLQRILNEETVARQIIRGETLRQSDLETLRRDMLEAGQPIEALKQTLTLVHQLDMQGLEEEADDLLRATRAHPTLEHDTRARLSVDLVITIRGIDRGDPPERTLTRLDAVIQEARKRSWPDVEIRARVSAGVSWSLRGDHKLAIESLILALDLSQYVVDAQGYLIASTHLAIAHWRDGSLAEMYGVLLRAQTSLNDLQPSLGDVLAVPVIEDIRQLVGVEVFEQARVGFHRRFKT